MFSLLVFDTLLTNEATTDRKATRNTQPNPLIAKYEKRNHGGVIEYTLQTVTNANLKRKDLLSVERHTYYEKLSKLQQKNTGTPRVADWTMFYVYSFDETLALSIDGVVYPEWCSEFFSTMYFEKDIDRSNLMKENAFGYFVDDEIEECSEPFECQKWTTKMLAGELDLDEYKLLGSTELPMPASEVREQGREPNGLKSSWGYDVRGSSRGFDDDDDAMKD
ncbi:hypothetical protein Tco_0648159 [Tanacetum coccineum]